MKKNPTRVAICCRKEDPFQGPKLGSCLTLGNELSEETHGVQMQETSETVYQIGRYEFFPTTKVLKVDQCEIILPAREAEVLLSLCRDSGRTVNSSALLKELWGDDNYFNLRSLNVYITRLRNHFKSDPGVEIESIRGIGYKLKY